MLKTINVEFKTFCTSVGDLRTYCQQSGEIQFKLPKTLKRSSGTRPWRSYFLIHNSLHQSFEQLLILLRECGEQHRLIHINPQLLHEISKFTENFSLSFDNLEFSNRLTLQNVMQSYYRMHEYCIIDKKQKHSIINLLKVEIAKQLDDKYWTSTTQLHWIPAYLDPTLKELLFVTDEKFLSEQKKLTKDGIHVSPNDFKDVILLSNERSHKNDSPSTTKNESRSFCNNAWWKNNNNFNYCFNKFIC